MTTPNPAPHERTVIVDRFEGADAVLRVKDSGQEIIWPKKLLPENTHAGSVLTLTVRTEEDAESERRELAKTLLNEILQPES